jgi:simple sugar transport system ATP-binding protein
VAVSGTRVRLEGITKRFASILAVDHATLDLMPGQVHAVLGENGAGKTTLMSILYGIHRPDAGRVLVNDQEVVIRRPADAIALGVGMVHQHFKLVASFTVAENLILARRSDFGLVLDLPRARAEARRIASAYGLDVRPDACVAELSLAARQRVEILKALYRDARILILDEPTTILAPAEVRSLVAVLRTIAAEGRAVVLITHRLAEAFEVGDVLTVMRRGKVVATHPTRETNPAKVATLMVGHEVPRGVSRRATQPPGNVVLEVNGLSVPGGLDSPGLRNVSLTIRAGEVLALAGVEGNGQRELVEVLAGLRRPTVGRIAIGGAPLDGSGRVQSAALDVRVIPEDCQAEGLVLEMTLSENVVLDRMTTPAFSRNILLRLGAIRAFAREMIARFGIHAASEQVRVRTLSGGNQQRVMLARVLSAVPRLLVASQPTRGLDIAAAKDVLDRLADARAHGAAVLFISSDLDEILSIGDRVLVLDCGRVAGVLPAAVATRERLGTLLTGAAGQVTTTADEAPAGTPERTPASARRVRSAPWH